MDTVHALLLRGGGTHEQKGYAMTRHYIAFWNLENLFAPEDFPDREPWLARKMAGDLRGWTEELFDLKLDRLASIIMQMNNGKGPDLLGVCEVENAWALGRLAALLDSMAAGRQYGVAHVDSSRDQRGIDTAFVYDTALYSVDPDALFSHFVMRRTGTRDITQATFRTLGGNELVALCNHWPSRSGGTHESRGYRMTAGETLSYWQQRIWEVKGADTPIIAFGDFNDDPFDESLTQHARATRERGDIERSRTAAGFYNLSWNYMRQSCLDRKGNAKLLHGTLYYGGDGNIFDQILVAKGLLDDGASLRVDENSARIEAFPEMVDHRVAFGPIRFGLPKGDPDKNIDTEGFSDHFPVSVVLLER
jgi:hypothetical protein